MATRTTPLLAALLVAVAAIACTKTKPAATLTASPAADAAVVNLYIWSNYTAPDVLAAFTKRTGIKVNVANYASNEELLAKLQAGAEGYDIVVPSDYMVAIMIKLGLLADLDRSKIAHADQIDGRFLHKPYDPDNRYSLPYAWTFTGIAVDRASYPDAVTGWADLLANPKVRGRLSLLDDVREVVGAALKLHGASLNSTDPAALASAKATLAAAKSNVKAFTSTPMAMISGGELAMAHMYSNDTQVAARTSGRKIDFILPKEGATLAIDNAVILKSAPHPAAAYALLSALYDPHADADLVTRTFSGPVLQGIQALLPAPLATNALLFPTADMLARGEMIQDLGDATITYDRLWTEIKAASH